MSSLGLRYNLSEAAIIRFTREGLRHRELQTALATSRFATMKELRETCATYFQNTKLPASKTAQDQNVNQTIQRRHDTTTGSNSKTLICFNCNEPGHISSKCPKPPRRQRCRDCQRVHPRNEPENCGQRITVRKVVLPKTLNVFEKLVNVNGYQLIAFIDTGSECHLIRRSSVEKLSCAREACNLKLSGLWGGTIVSKEIAFADIIIDRITLKLQLHIVDDQQLTTDLLLGAPLFTTEELSAHINQGEIIFTKATKQAKVNQATKCKSLIEKKDLTCGLNDEAEDRSQQAIVRGIEIKDDKHWDTKIRDIQWSLNTTKSSSTGFTPHQLVYNYQPRDALHNKLALALHNDHVVTQEELEQRQQEAADRFNQRRAQVKRRHELRHSKPSTFDVGDMVLVENEPVSTGTSRKLEPRNKGPYIITKNLGRDRYVIEDLPKSRRSKKHYTGIFASDKIKRWCRLPDRESESDTSNDESVNEVVHEEDGRL